MRNINMKLWNAHARIEDMILLAGSMHESSCLPENLKEFFEEEDVETIESCFGQLPSEVKSDLMNEDIDPLVGYLFENRKLGFIAKFATPHAGSWGCYCTGWVYGDTLEELIDNGLKWVESCSKRTTTPIN